MKTLLINALAVIGLSGCVAWPPHGHSGAAEQIRVRGDNSVERVRLIAAHHELTALEGVGAADHFPAALETARLQWVRTARALEGDFEQAARGDLDRLDGLLASMRETLNGRLSIALDRIAEREKEASR